MKNHTPPQPSYLVVDIRDVVRDHMKHRRLYYLYNVFPLKDIIQTVLSVRACDDNGEFFFDQADQRLAKLPSLPTHVDVYNELGLFHELLTTYLDEYIRLKTPSYIDTDYYIFLSWLGPTTLILQRDEHAFSSYGAVQTNYR